MIAKRGNLFHARKKYNEAQMSETAAKPKTDIRAFLERAALVMFGLGFAAGMPNQLAGAALALWLREAGISLSLLALLGLATLTYSLKFLWAPVVDRVALPILDKKFGRRRSWMILTQLIVMLGLFLISGFDPAKNIGAFAAIAVLIAFAGATQDIAIDAWRIEVAQDENKLGILTATYQWGYRIAVLVSGALPLLIAQYFNGDDYKQFGWGMAYAAMAALMIIPIISSMLAPRELAEPAPRWIAPADVINNPFWETIEWIVRLLIMALGAAFLAAGLAGKHEPIAWLVGGLYGGIEEMGKAFTAKPWGVWQQVGCAIIGLGFVYFACRPIPNVKTKPGAYFQSALGEPLIDFFKRYENAATLILVFICVYRIADFLLNIAGALYLDAGFSKDEIAIAQKGFGVAMTAVGVGIAGWSVLRFGLFKSLFVGAFLQPISNIAFGLITFFGNSSLPIFEGSIIQPVLWTVIGIDNISAGFAGVCLIVYMSRLTKEGFTATQYALFSSLYSLPGKVISALSGRVVEGAAKSANDGALQFMKPMFGHLPTNSFAEPAQKLGIEASALAAGYTAFFFYTAALGIFAIFMAALVSRGKPRELVDKSE